MPDGDNDFTRSDFAALSNATRTTRQAERMSKNAGKIEKEIARLNKSYLVATSTDEQSAILEQIGRLNASLNQIGRDEDFIENPNAGKASFVAYKGCGLFMTVIVAAAMLAGAYALLF